MRNMSEEREEVIVGERRYRLDRMEYASRIHRICDVCGEKTQDVYIQTEEKRYWNPILQRYSWTHAGCDILFGHKKCLKRIRG